MTLGGSGGFCQPVTGIGQPQSGTLQATPAFCLLLQKPSPPHTLALMLLSPPPLSPLCLFQPLPLRCFSCPPPLRPAPPPSGVRLFVTAGGPCHQRTSSSPRSRTSLAASHTPKRSHSHSKVAAHLPAARGEALSRTGGEGGGAQMDTQEWRQQIVSKVRD